MLQLLLPLALGLIAALVSGQIANPTPEPIYRLPPRDGPFPAHDGFQMFNGTAGKSRIALQVPDRLAIRQVGPSKRSVSQHGVL
jgi:hypothetical protein